MRIMKGKGLTRRTDNCCCPPLPPPHLDGRHRLALLCSIQSLHVVGAVDYDAACADLWERGGAEVWWGKCRGMGAGSAARAGTEVKMVHCTDLMAGRLCWAADALKLAANVAQSGGEQIWGGHRQGKPEFS